MKMRRVVLEVLVPAEDYASNGAIVEAVEHGLLEHMWSAQQDVLLRDTKDDLVEVNAAQWRAIKAGERRYLRRSDYGQSRKRHTDTVC
jgi:hypothetical protein